MADLDQSLQHWAADYVRALEHRVSILRQLDAELSKGRSATVLMDYDQILRCNETQTGICDELKACDGKIAVIEEHLSAGVPMRIRWNQPRTFHDRFASDVAHSLGKLILEMSRLQQQVRYKNQVCGNLVLRTRRTLGILDNLLVLYTGNPYSSALNLESVSGASSLRH